MRDASKHIDSTLKKRVLRRVGLFGCSKYVVLGTSAWNSASRDRTLYYQMALGSISRQVRYLYHPRVQHSSTTKPSDTGGLLVFQSSSSTKFRPGFLAPRDRVTPTLGRSATCLLP